MCGSTSCFSQCLSELLVYMLQCMLSCCSGSVALLTLAFSENASHSVMRRLFDERGDSSEEVAG